MTNIVIFGGQGSGAIVAQSLAALKASGINIDVLGFLNDALPRGEMVSGLPVLGPFASWRDLPEDTACILPLHKVSVMEDRLRIIERLAIPNDRYVTVLDPRSSIAQDATIGPGCFVGPFASVGPAAVIGAHCVVRAGAHVSHDCMLGDFVFTGSNAVVCGYARADTGAYIAPGASIRDGCRIGKFAVVGLGAVVTKDVMDNTTVVGSPARPQPQR